MKPMRVRGSPSLGPSPRATVQLDLQDLLYPLRTQDLGPWLQTSPLQVPCSPPGPQVGQRVDQVLHLVHHKDSVPQLCLSFFRSAQSRHTQNPEGDPERGGPDQNPRAAWYVAPDVVFLFHVVRFFIHGSSVCPEREARSEGPWGPEESDELDYLQSRTT